MELTIEKLIYGGDGLARLPADERGRGKAVFLPFVLAGEKVEGIITEQRPGYARARLEQVIVPSPHRLSAPCPYFTRCGGCHYQHASYEQQLEIKATILTETLRRIAKLALTTELQVYPSGPWLYRNRARMRLARPASTGAGEFKLGYNCFASHEVLAVEECPISSPLINRAIAVIWELGRAGKVSDEIFELQLFANAADNQLLLEICVSEPNWRWRKSTLPDFVIELRAKMPEIAGVAVFQASGEGRRIREDIPPELQGTFGTSHLAYETTLATYRVSAGAFFQTNRFLTDTLVEIVTAGQDGNLALDLYAGTGLFSMPLARCFREVMAVESERVSLADLEFNGGNNVRAFGVTAEKFFGLPAANARFDLAVVDPPRSGLGRIVLSALAARNPARIVYISCDPATLARDLAALVSVGYQVEQAHLVDLFPQTFHIESVLHLVR